MIFPGVGGGAGVGVRRIFKFAKRMWGGGHIFGNMTKFDFSTPSRNWTCYFFKMSL